jgi:aminoglycoside phosphotransferase (APT) family kinase protein
VGYAKAAGTASVLDGDDTVAVEQAVLGRLGREGFTPFPVHGGGPGTVWTLAVDGVELGEVRGSARSDPNAFAAHLGARLGERLGEFHRLPQLTFPRRAPRPWPLGHDLLPSMEAAPRTDELEEVLDAWFEPEVRAMLDRARASWDRRCSPVHGDLSAHNVIVDLSTSGMPVTFIDLEACGLGDPDWDVVSLLRSLGEALADTGLEAIAEASFRAAYANRSGRVGGPDPAFACARALATAWQCASHPLPQVRSRTAGLLEAARRVAESVAVAS